jgi:UDPglucose 6-dehydrogenase
VTAACLAAAGHEVRGLDRDERTIDGLRGGRAPVSEPGLDDLIAANPILFTTDDAEGLRGAEVLWVTYDTPVDDDDRADTAFVIERITELLPKLDPGTLVIVSSQLPVGSIRTLEQRAEGRQITFAALPENLRLGKAIEVFTKPDRVIAGVRNDADRARITALLAPFTDRIEWMSIESAEMTKHALNAFLALSVTFINEIATICEQVGADAKEVERGLKTESRIGPRAYLGPGAAFAGGTLARDIAFLTTVGKQHGRTPPLIAAVKTSNDQHKAWTRTKLQSLLGDLRGKRVAVWGLTYKPGTDTLRRSGAVELCRWLAAQGAQVTAHDPAVKSLPEELASVIDLQSSAIDAIRSADALVVATEWPDYKSADRAGVAWPRTVIDPNRFLRDTFESDPSVRYVTIGKGAA